MAFNDTLFQLGMDLTRSSPAQRKIFPRLRRVRARHLRTLPTTARAAVIQAVIS